MSRNSNSSGGFNRFLNFIGIVDDVGKPKQSAQSFNTGSGYGQPEAYTPASRSTAASGRTASRRSIPAQGSRSNPGSRRVYDDEYRYASSRPTSRFEESSQQDFAPQQRQPRSRSRFEEESDPAAPERSSAPNRNAAPQRPAPRSSGHTVTCTLYVLTDVNPVIKALIRGDTIYMNLLAPYENEARRILDTLSGAVFALDAQFKQPNKEFSTYVIAPKSVNIQSIQELED